MQQLLCLETYHAGFLQGVIIAQVIPLLLQADADPVTALIAGDASEAAGVVTPALPGLQPFNAGTVHKMERILDGFLDFLLSAATADRVSVHQAVFRHLRDISAVASASPEYGSFAVPPVQRLQGRKPAKSFSCQIPPGCMLRAPGFTSAAPGMAAFQRGGDCNAGISAVASAEPGGFPIHVLRPFEHGQHAELLSRQILRDAPLPGSLRFSATATATIHRGAPLQPLGALLDPAAAVTDAFPDKIAVLFFAGRPDRCQAAEAQPCQLAVVPVLFFLHHQANRPFRSCVRLRMDPDLQRSPNFSTRVSSASACRASGRSTCTSYSNPVA